MTKSVPTARGSMTASELRDDLIMQAVNDDDFRARLIADPRATLQDIYGISLPERLNVIVHEDDSTTAHIRVAALEEAHRRGAGGFRRRRGRLLLNLLQPTGYISGLPPNVQHDAAPDPKGSGACCVFLRLQAVLTIPYG